MADEKRRITYEDARISRAHYHSAKIEEILEDLEKGRIVIFAGGTGNPYFSTDTAAALRAIEINADVIIKGTKVDGIYTSDPSIDFNAKKYDAISYKEVIEKELRVMDLTAITLCKENNLPIIVFDINSNTGLLDIINSVPTGTMVSLKGEFNND